MQEKEHVISLLEETREAVKNQDVVGIKDLSNQTIHVSSVHQDPDNILVAVILYSLSKIIERKNYRDYKEWPQFYKNYILNIKNAITDLKNNNIKHFRVHIQQIVKETNKLSKNFKNHIQDVFRKAKINKASRIYEHGISMEQTAKILGISIWELAEYAGNTRISDINFAVTIPIKKRIKTAEEIFK